MDQKEIDKLLKEQRMYSKRMDNRELKRVAKEAYESDRKIKHKHDWYQNYLDE